MMVTGGSTHSQVWLTYALSDSDVGKALTLCFSMKRVFTSRKLAVLVSRRVSASMKELLHHAYNFVFYMEEELNTAGLKEEEYVKLLALKLKGFSKIVFLEPTMFVVENSDDIFDNCEVTSGLLTTEVGLGDIDDGLSIFVAKPCLQVFRALMDSLQTRTGMGVETYLRNWAAKNLPSTAKPLDRKYSGKLSTSTDAILRNAWDISLVNIDIPFQKSNTEDFGLCAKVNTIFHKQRSFRKTWRLFAKE
ncbi:unnamed protein product [Orchesella dallaii]|uniref:Uncharacterized protein n=1 Tax=Orchesella dallaii TaxID=48710 RepID=A0ABP1S4U3_9HEXA